MKSKRQMPLAEALDEITAEVQRLKKDGSARMNGHEIKMDDPVTLEIEKEAGRKGAELEFEIKWPAKKGSKAAERSSEEKPRRRIRRRWLALGLVAALAAGAVMIARRRHFSGEEDEEEADL